MKLQHFLFAPVWLAAALLQAQTEPFAAWTHRTSVEVGGAGLTRVELSRELLDASRAATGTSPLRDLRLINASGVETPFLIEWPRVVPGSTVGAESFRASLQGNTTVLEINVPGGSVVEEVRLQTGHRDFIKRATLEGTLDGTQWRIISDHELLFRQGGAERLRFALDPAAWKSLRITLDDERNGPIGFTGATLLVHEQDETPISTENIEILSREEAKGETRLKLDLGGQNRHLHSLHISAGDAVFQREVSLEVPSDDGSASTVAGRRTIYRVALDDRQSEDLDFRHRQMMPARIVMLRILNGDNPPLRIEKIEGRFSRISLVFHAEASGMWQLLAGNANASVPRYDMAGLLGNLRKTKIAAATTGTIEANPSFNKEATLPEAGEGGATLDVSAWAYRKDVSFAETGVILVELDAEALAHTALDQRDLRVMQEGRQLPYFIQRGLPFREVAVKFQQEPDAKQPTLSRWRVELPFAGYPVVQLIAESQTPLFERRIRIWEDARDDYGNSFRRGMGEAWWKRTPGLPAAPLNVHLPSSPKGNVLFVETDNGDNAPLQLSSVKVAFAPVSVVFKTTSTAPVHIVYGNPRASAPRYDIQLSRTQFERTGKINASLGAEERTDGYKAPKDPDAPGLGSAWLWAALALVVAGLLWIVAKLLPAEAASNGKT